MIQFQMGRYSGEIVSHVIESAKTGTEQLVIVVRVDQDGFGNPVNSANRTIFLAITPKTIDYLIPKLRSAGFTGNDFTPLLNSQFEKSEIIGNRVTLFCKHEPDRAGEMRERWDILPNTQRQANPVSTNSLRNLNSLFGRKFREFPTNAPNQLSQQQAPQSEGYANVGFDDDVPF